MRISSSAIAPLLAAFATATAGAQVPVQLSAGIVPGPGGSAAALDLLLEGSAADAGRPFFLIPRRSGVIAFDVLADQSLIRGVLDQGGSVRSEIIPRSQQRLDNVEIVAVIGGRGSVARETVALDLGTLLDLEDEVVLGGVRGQNVVIAGGRAFVAAGTAGLQIVDLQSRAVETIQAPPGVGRIDDLSVDGEVLFVMDGVQGRLASLDTAGILLSGPFNVNVGPFSGVSAAGGRVVVSGGTGRLNVRSYDANGVISAVAATSDLGVGQPDVLLSEDGVRAYVSTDFAGFVGGASFGITTIELREPPTAPSVLSRTGLIGAGFTSGSRSPANFPIEAALFGGDVLVATGAGLSLLDASGALLSTTGVGFPAISVDTAGEDVAVVGGRSLAILERGPAGGLLPRGSRILASAGSATGVSMDDDFVVVARPGAGLVIVAR